MDYYHYYLQSLRHHLHQVHIGEFIGMKAEHVEDHLDHLHIMMKDYLLDNYLVVLVIVKPVTQKIIMANFPVHLVM